MSINKEVGFGTGIVRSDMNSKVRANGQIGFLEQRTHEATKSLPSNGTLLVISGKLVRQKSYSDFR